MKVEGENGVEGRKGQYRVGRELVSQAVVGSELMTGIMQWQKGPTSSSCPEQRQRDKLARKSQKADGRSLSPIVDDALLFFPR